MPPISAPMSAVPGKSISTTGPTIASGTAPTLAGGTSNAGVATSSCDEILRVALVAGEVRRDEDGGGAVAVAVASIAKAALPVEANATLGLIDHNGPFPHQRDGIVFRNREGKLPAQPDGYYHEYTVETPGAKDRGARRIVAGSAGERYYSDDHYATFKKID